MSKKYLGIICLLYSGIFGYVVFFDKLKNFLAPQMQIYIKLSIIPMLIIGIVMLFNNKVNYKFKASDLVLILPLVLLILSGDGRLTASFASNRTMNFNTENRTKAEVKEKSKEESKKETVAVTKPAVIKEEKQEEIKPIVVEEQKPTYDFTNPYFNVIDETYSDLANYLTFASKADKYQGKTIKVKGFVLKEMALLTSEYFALGKYNISCCAADAEFTGFIVKYDRNKVKENGWYEIEGILEKGVDSEGYNIMYINVVNIKEVDAKSEEQYVYPCYAYDEGLCAATAKYNLEY
ncbi:MAG: TIGR03943 family protein [Bacilli bacterium]|nr:TIGR03943 family protein [Bacilli bacterium]